MDKKEIDHKPRFQAAPLIGLDYILITKTHFFSITFLKPKAVQAITTLDITGKNRSDRSKGSPDIMILS